MCTKQINTPFLSHKGILCFLAEAMGLAYKTTTVPSYIDMSPTSEACIVAKVGCYEQ